MRPQKTARAEEEETTMINLFRVHSHLEEYEGYKNVIIDWECDRPTRPDLPYAELITPPA